MPRLATFLRRALLAAALLPALAHAKSAPPAAGPSRVIVFVGADDRGAENSALKLGGLVEEAVARNDKHKVVSLADAAGDRLGSDVRAARRAAEDDLAQGKRLLAEGKLDDAEAALRSSIKNGEAAAAGLEKLDDLADAHAALAAVLHLKHKEDDAKDALAEALSLKPTYRPDAKLAAGPVGELLRTVKREAADIHRGSISAFSTPTGGRVFLDGEVRGYTPLTIDRIPVGKHLVRMERPGYQNFGQAIEVTSTEEVAVKGHLTPTKDFAEVEDQVGQALKEVDSASAGPAAFKLLSHFHADRGVFANVRTSGDNLVLDLALVDARAHKRVAHRRNSFEGEDPKNLEREVGRLVQALLADADEGAPAKASSGSKDPLDSVSGTEDWDEDHGGSKRRGSDDEDAPRKKKKPADDE